MELHEFNVAPDAISAQSVAEVRLPLHALLPLLPGIRRQERDPRRREGAHFLDFLPQGHHRVDAVRVTLDFFWGGGGREQHTTCGTINLTLLVV